MYIMKTCCFYGYESFEDVDLRDLKFFLRPAIISVINEGVDTFLFGNGSDFEFLAWCYVQELKRTQEYSHIKLIGHFEPMTPNQLISKFNRVEWDNANFLNRDFAFFDKNLTFDFEYGNNDFNVSFIRDRVIINNVDCVVCYIEENFGLLKRVEYSDRIYYANFRSWLAYRWAVALDKRVINLINDKNIFFHINKN